MLEMKRKTRHQSRRLYMYQWLSYYVDSTLIADELSDIMENACSVPALINSVVYFATSPLLVTFMLTSSNSHKCSTESTVLSLPTPRRLQNRRTVSRIIGSTFQLASSPSFSPKSQTLFTRERMIEAAWFALAKKKTSPTFGLWPEGLFKRI